VVVSFAKMRDDAYGLCDQGEVNGYRKELITWCESAKAIIW
jgi:hypothetical protein